MVYPELSIDQAMADYHRLGYSDRWINQRLKGIEVRKELTDEWKRGGVKEGLEYASLTDIITKAWSGKTTKQYNHFKGLKKENLRDNMTNVELALNTLAEASATEISNKRNSKGFRQNAQVAKEGGSVANASRKQLESKMRRKLKETYSTSILAHVATMVIDNNHDFNQWQRKEITTGYLYHYGWHV
jgi:hypothetical protein